jgi:hypothetical protein
VLPRSALILLATLQLIGVASAGIDEKYARPGEGWGVEVFEKVFGQRIFGKSYAVVIGIGWYDNFSELDAPSADAVKMKDFLINEADFDIVFMLTDDKATKERIDYLMEDVLPGLIAPGDRFIFYFSGHGTTRTLANGKRGYLVLGKSRTNDWNSMIDMPRVKEWAENVDTARHVLFLLDACFSGLTMAQVKSGDATPETMARLEQPAHHLVTAGVDTEESYIYNGKSIFTDLFLKAARGQYSDAANGVISLSEIMNDVNRAKDQMGADLGHAINMTPHMYETRLEDNSGEFFFLVRAPIRETPVSVSANPSISGKSAAIETAVPPDTQSPARPSAPTQGQPLSIMARCEDEWNTATANNATNGVTWQKFLTQCRRFQEGAGAPTQGQPPSIMARCGDEWKAAKANNTIGGVTWPQFLARCRLQQAGAQPQGRPMLDETGATGAGKFPSEAEAKARCPADQVVWLNANPMSHTYYYMGSRNYGATKEGAYMCEADAHAAGNRPVKTKPGQLN